MGGILEITGVSTITELCNNGSHQKGRVGQLKPGIGGLPGRSFSPTFDSLHSSRCFRRLCREPAESCGHSAALRRARMTKLSNNAPRPSTQCCTDHRGRQA
jgi:hypothetical protein